MILIIIALIICLGVAIWGAIHEDWDRVLGFFTYGMISGVVSLMLLMAVFIGGQIVNSKEETVKYQVKLASLKDGSELEGSLHGGLFVSRGQIGEVQYFSFYKDNGNGSFSLDKKEADRSLIIPDATPETARLDITDTISWCEPAWWNLCDGTRSGIYVHGDFHVPVNSIKNDFVLDAE